MRRYPEFRYETAYRAQDVDFDGDRRFRPLRWFVLFQEMAIRHARQLNLSIEKLRHDRYTWVLSGIRLKMGYNPPCDAGLRLMTWPSGFERLVACRSFLAADNADRVIASGESDWLIIDVETRRPMRIEPFVTHIAIPEVATARRIGRIPTPDSPVFHDPFTVKPTDIDVNGHVNNLRYVEWLLEHIPGELRESSSLAELAINYLAESLPGDRISVGMAREDGRTLLHSIRRVGDGREIVRAQSIWT